MRCLLLPWMLLWLSVGVPLVAGGVETVKRPYFGIRLIDTDSGRGIPLVELRTVNDIVLFSDSAGWVAFHEVELMDREVFFSISSPGYEYAKDGFGYRGVRLTTTPGSVATIRLKRNNIAQRMYRVTGQGMYRDSQLLGLPHPLKLSNIPGGVLGQDSVQAVPYGDEIFWLWGDTSRPGYPLGNFHTTCATSPQPGTKTFSPQNGVALSYFLDRQRPGRVRAMMPMNQPGPVWLFGLLNVKDAKGKQTLLAHYSRRKNLAEAAEHGLARFDDEAGMFEKVVELDLNETWRYPRGNAVAVEEEGSKYFYFCEPLAHTRVKASWQSLIDPDQYESLAFDADAGEYRWQRRRPPTTQTDERKLIESGKLKKQQARFQLRDAQTKDPVAIHRSAINWNPFRKRWIMIGVEQNPQAKPSLLGEVWYAEAAAPSGPWRRAVKIATHPHYSFYNPRHHTFFDEHAGRVIYFEGTYTRMFSGNPVATPRYDYNQLMYRLDLGDKRLSACW